MKPIIPEAALQQHIAILGKTGSGKTSTGKLMVEQVAEDSRVCILDTVKSDWWGITSSADGKRPGLPFHILGGPHGHVPLHSSAGKAIGELVAKGALRHSIIDMADFEAGGAQRFFVDFAPVLLRHMKGVLYLVIEEAHELAPKERAGFGAENMAIHYAKKLATAGRSKGIRLVVLTQRTQSLHNALLGSCDTLIAHRFTAPADQEPVVKWLKSNLEPGLAKEVAASLSSLKTGEGWLCSGEAKIFERRLFPRIKTYDNSATPTNDTHQHDVKTAPVDQEKLRAIIGDAVKEAEADDPRKLRAEIQRLTKELRDLATTPRLEHITQEHLKQAEVQGRMAGRDDVLNIIHPVHQLVASLRTAIDSIEGNAGTAVGHLVDIEEVLRRGPKPVAPVGTLTYRRPIPYSGRMPIDIQTTPKPRPATTSSGNGEVGKSGLRRMLIALAQRQSGLTRKQLGVRAGISSRSGTFDTYLSRARSSGWVEDVGDGRIRITEPGEAALGGYEPLPEGKELLAYWTNQLGASGAARILQALASVYPRELSREELGEAASLSARSGTFDTYLSRLRTLELVVGNANGLRASEELFG